jgi:hypothetical protein
LLGWSFFFSSQQFSPASPTPPKQIPALLLPSRVGPPGCGLLLVDQGESLSNEAVTGGQLEEDCSSTLRDLFQSLTYASLLPEFIREAAGQLRLDPRFGNPRQRFGGELVDDLMSDTEAHLRRGNVTIIELVRCRSLGIEMLFFSVSVVYVLNQKQDTTRPSCLDSPTGGAATSPKENGKQEKGKKKRERGRRDSWV